MATLATASVHFVTTREHDNFRELKADVRAKAHAAAYNFARGMVAEAKRRVPVRTGYLRQNIYWEKIAPGEFRVGVKGDTTAQTGAYYGVYIEYGTRNMAAQPYFRPAFEIMKKKFQADMRLVFR